MVTVRLAIHADEGRGEGRGEGNRTSLSSLHTPLHGHAGLVRKVAAAAFGLALNVSDSACNITKICVVVVGECCTCACAVQHGQNDERRKVGKRHAHRCIYIGLVTFARFASTREHMCRRSPRHTIQSCRRGGVASNSFALAGMSARYSPFLRRKPMRVSFPCQRCQHLLMGLTPNPKAGVTWTLVKVG